MLFSFGKLSIWRRVNLLIHTSGALMCTVALTMAPLTIRSFLLLLLFVFLLLVFLHVLHGRSYNMIDKHFWGNQRARTFLLLIGLYAVIPLSFHRLVFDGGEGERKEVNVQVFYADLGQDTAIRCYRAFYLQMFNPWTIKWTNCTHGLTFSETLQTDACWRLLRHG